MGLVFLTYRFYPWLNNSNLALTSCQQPGFFIPCTKPETIQNYMKYPNSIPFLDF